MHVPIKTIVSCAQHTVNAVLVLKSRIRLVMVHKKNALNQELMIQFRTKEPVISGEQRFTRGSGICLPWMRTTRKLGGLCCKSFKVTEARSEELPDAVAINAKNVYDNGDTGQENLKEEITKILNASCLQKVDKT